MLFRSSMWHHASKRPRLISSHLHRFHEGEVVGLTLHPTGDYFASASTDGSWAFNDIQEGRSLAHVRADEPEGRIRKNDGRFRI